MTTRLAGSNYQSLATEFHVEDVVVPYGANRDFAGRVTAVWPAIGMVDVVFAAGVKRYPVEDLLRLSEKGNPEPPHTGYVPGGQGTVSVPGGPVASRVVKSHQKQALYWAAKDRQYRATAQELTSGSYNCPKCKKAALKKAIYRRVQGQSEHLYGCPTCLFLIARDSLIHEQGVA